MANFWPLCMSCALAACAGDGEGLDESGRPLGEGDSGTLQPTFQSIQDRVFTPVCTGCHAGAGAPLGLRLDEGASYALLVNASSAEVPALRRVQPGDPDASYLIQKLEGTAAVGSRMPLNAPPLPQATIDVIRQWITDGAQDGATEASGPTLSKAGSFESARLTAISPMHDQAVAGSIREIVIASDIELDTSLLQSGLVTLRASGGDSEFESGNELAVPLDVVVRSRQPTVLAIAPRLGTLAVDAYELRISGTDPVALADYRARAIDGDADGLPGGDFALRFTVEMAR